MAKKHKSPRILQKIKANLLPAILSLILLVLLVVTYQVFVSDKYFPRTKIGDTDISLLTEGQAIRKVQDKFSQRATQQIQFSSPWHSFTVDLATSSAGLDYNLLTALFNRQHSPTLIDNFKNQLQALIFGSKAFPKVNLSLDQQLNSISSVVDSQPQNAQLQFTDTSSGEASTSAQIQIKAEVDGSALDKKALQDQVSLFLISGQYQNSLPIKVITPKITTPMVLRAKQALEQTSQKPLKLYFENQSWIIDTKQLLTLLDLTSGENLLLSKDNAYLYLKQIAQNIDQDVREGLFEFNPATKRVTAFKASQEGRKLNLDKSYQLITDALTNHTTANIQLPVDIVKPKIQTSDVNSLGINELLGRGVSNFAGSIANRIYNITLTAQKLNGVLVPPGEIFSFNQTVGDISAATGYKQAYVIKEGRTVLDDGGGVCQDSTTLFRAVLNAGLPVLKRTAHAYRVGYYEQGFPPGLDATVFYPSVDFQFKNDTPKYILIQAYTEGITLYVDLYGTSDGRVATISRSAVTNQTPPPPDLRQDDPTLPKGVVKQVDFSAWGATVSFNRTVTRGSETLIKETFVSNYKPWQAIYLVGTQ